MFGFRKKPAVPLPVEWQSGRVRHVAILDALEQATDGVVTLYEHGVAQWTRDVGRLLHEFTVRMMAEVLACDSGGMLPVYVAQRSQESTPTSDPPQRQTAALPASFAAAFECKQRWLAGTADDAAVGTAAANVLADMQHFWPSNFCLHINSRQLASWCVLSALNLEAPWLGAHGCAQTAAHFLGHRAGCAAMHCTNTPHELSDLTWEAAQLGTHITTRGVACPQAGNREWEAIATNAMQGTISAAWARFNADLAAALRTSAA